jgi:hypothetical protein
MEDWDKFRKAMTKFFENPDRIANLGLMDLRRNNSVELFDYTPNSRHSVPKLDGLKILSLQLRTQLCATAWTASRSDVKVDRKRQGATR